MSVTVRLGSALRTLTNGQREVTAHGDNIGELLDTLGIRDRLTDGTGKLRRHFNIHVNDGDDVRLQQGLDTPVGEGDTVTILSAIAGGGEVSRRIWLTFPLELVGEPVIWELGRKFDVVFNIRQASVSREVGVLGLELSGDEAEIQGAVDFLTEKGVSVEPVELGVVE